MKIKKGDQVIVISGKYKGKKGKVLKVIPKEGKIVVEGVNMIKKHMRPRKEGEKGEVVHKPAPIYVSKVMLICPKCKKLTRVGYKIVDGKKYRICKKCKSEI